MTVKTFEFRIDRPLADWELSALRWELFLFHEIADVARTDRADVLAIVYAGDEPDAAAWVDAVAALGYEVATVDAPGRPEAA